MFGALRVFLLLTITSLQHEKQTEASRLTMAPSNNGESKTIPPTPTKECNFQNVPQCMEVVLQPYQFEYTGNGEIRIDVGYELESISNYSLATDNKTIAFCFPLSPQFHQCPLTCHQKTSYRIVNHTLYATRAGQEDMFLADLGDYYVDNDENAITCTKVISSGKRIRCNNIILNPDQRLIFDNGTMYSQMLKTAIHNAKYSILDEGQKLRLCYPLDINLLNCIPCRYEKLPSQFFDLRYDYSIYIPWWDISINAGNYYYENDNDSDPYFCRGPRMFRIQQWTFDILVCQVFKLCYVLSGFFLMAAVLVELILPTLTSYDKSFLCHNISITIFYIYMAICRYVDVCYSENSAICCTLFAIAYLSSMSTFCWLNVCAFDVWRSFKCLETPQVNVVCQNKRFRSYCQFAWGGPILLCTITLVINFSPKIQSLLSLNFLINCTNWFEDPLSRVLFYTIPIMISVIANIILFILTIYCIKKAISETQIVCRQRKTKL